jgi:pimeloyl-ACP methyl ester carboxylesterase
LTVGGQSPPFFPAVVSRIASVLPHSARHSYERAGHVPHQSHPDEFVDVLRGFLAG